jgi:hypothetical protein
MKFFFVLGKLKLFACHLNVISFQEVTDMLPTLLNAAVTIKGDDSYTQNGGYCIQVYMFIGHANVCTFAENIL